MSANADSPRLRFAKTEISRVLRALEEVDANRLDHAIKCLRLEDELADAREQTTRWRQGYEAMLTLLEQTCGLTAEERLERLDAAVRTWVGRV